ncbi:hypothetical protein [Flavobacterium sp.]|uniref:hypothetical protein n=1 Tax=Flavobacterium sp. TaxID=239 RepID=UPI00261C9498|nr:hypothetical protein [Flavobacterium sp.]
MKIIGWLLEFFRKKEYYQIDYRELNNLAIEFKEITNTDLGKIEKVITERKEANSISDLKAKLFERKATKFISMTDLMEAVNQTVIDDYRKTYFEAIENKWNFNYFVTTYNPLHKESMLICNRLFSAIDDDLGGVIYPLLAIRKYQGSFYLWNFVEEYDGFL